jgi:uncharacterized protein (DUF2147 family)
MLRRFFAPRKRRAPTPRPFVELHLEQLEKREVLDASLVQGLGFVTFNAYQTAQQIQQAQGATQTALNQFYSDSASYTAGKGATFTQISQDMSTLHQDADRIQQLNSTFQTDIELFVMGLMGNMGDFSSDDTGPLLVEAYFLGQAQSIVNPALQTAGEASSVTPPATTQSGPVIGSLTASPNPVAPGGSETLTASNVTDGNPNGIIAQVAFYLDSNNDGALESGTDMLLGDATQTSPGVWTGTANVPANTPAGTYKLFAQAKDSNGALSTPATVPLTITSGSNNNQSGPVIGSLIANPNPVAPGGSEMLTASNVTDGSSNGTITQVAFYLDSNGDGILEPDADQLLGDGTQTSPGVWAGSANVPADTPARTYILFAQAKDSNGALGTPTAVTLTVSSGSTNQSGPVIGSLTASPNPVAPGGSETLTASNVTDGSSNGTISQVAFYLDSNNDGTLEPGTDMLLGNATQTSPGVWTGTANTPANTPDRTYILFAQAKDSNGALSTPSAIPLTVNTEEPQQITFSLSPQDFNFDGARVQTTSFQITFTLPPGGGDLVDSLKQMVNELKSQVSSLVQALDQWVASLQADQSGPVIGSLTVSPNPVAPGGSETLTASNVTDGNSNGTITQVAFYLDSNNDGTLESGTDQLLGNATQTSPGVWAGTANVPANAAAGTYKLFAQAQDNNGILSSPIAVALTVTSGGTQSGPVIGSLTAGPNPVAPGGSETLTASNVTDGNSNGTITQVAFYLDSNNDGTLESGTDMLLGNATQTSPGVWTGTANVPTNTAAGTYKLFAQAKDSNGALSTPAAVPLTVTSGSTNQSGPVIGSLTAGPNPVAPGGLETLTASNVTDGNSNGTITQVAFYLDSNGDGVLEPGTDMLLGDATQTSPGVWVGTANAPAGTPIGTYQLFAQAKDSNGSLSAPATVTLVVA